MKYYIKFPIKYAYAIWYSVDGVLGCKQSAFHSWVGYIWNVMSLFLFIIVCSVATNYDKIYYGFMYWNKALIDGWVRELEWWF